MQQPGLFSSLSKITDIQNSDSNILLKREKWELSNIRRQRKRIEILTEQLSSLQIVYIAKIKQNIDLRKLNKKYKNMIQVNQQEIKQIKQELEINKQKVSNCTTDIQKLYNQNEKLKTQIEKIKKQSEIKQKKSAESIQNLQKLVKQISKKINPVYYSQQINSNQDIEKLKNQLKNTKLILQRVRMTNQQSNIQINKYLQEINNLRNMNYELESKMDRIIFQYNQLIQDYQNLEQQKAKVIEALEQKMKIIQRGHDKQLTAMKNPIQNISQLNLSDSQEISKMHSQIIQQKNREFNLIEEILQTYTIRNNDITVPNK